MAKTVRELQYRLRPRGRGAPPDLLPFLLAQASPTVRVETSVARSDVQGILGRTIDVVADPSGIVAARHVLQGYRPHNAVEKTLLAEGRTRLLLWYRYRPEANPSGFSNSALAFRHLGGESIVSDVTQGRDMVVRVLSHSGRPLRPFLDAVGRACDPVFDLVVDYMGPPRLPTRGGLSPSEDRLLRGALAAGYFAVPRKASLADVARQAGVSPSTASALLRRAAKKLAENWVGSRLP